MKSSDDRETLDKSKIKILKSKGPKMELWGTLERATWGKEKRGKELYIKTCCVQFVRNEQISEKVEWDRPHQFEFD